MSPESAPLLAVDGLVKRFGGFRALDALSFRVGAGEILGLVGPNGSGKTTCINVVSGLYRPDGGTIYFEGRSIGGLASHRLVHVGIKLKELARSGIALLVVEHLMGFIDQITDRIIVMNAGKEIFEGRLADA